MRRLASDWTSLLWAWRTWASEALTDAVAAHGYFYAPDPSSQSVCTIGGNVAENSGGAHCLKYGFTTTHVLGMDVVMPSGEMVKFGSAAPDAPGCRK